MESKPLVSVLMTVYNREKYIAEAIESVIASTYTNWELIIVDDRSKDKSVDIAKSFQEQDSRIKVHINEQNLGDYPNRNKAASYAKGKYLKYVDADDMIYPYGLEQLVYYMEQYPEASYGLCSLEQDKGEIFPILLTPYLAYQRHYFKKRLFHKAPLSAIIKKDVFDSVNGFTGKRMLGDFEMWHLLSKKYSVLAMPHGIVWYREHDEQEMSDHRSDPMEPFKYILLSEDMLSSIDCPLTEEDKKRAIRQVRYKKARSVLSAFKHHSFKKGMELKKNSGLSYFQLINTFIAKK